MFDGSSPMTIYVINFTSSSIHLFFALLFLVNEFLNVQYSDFTLFYTLKDFTYCILQDRK